MLIFSTLRRLLMCTLCLLGLPLLVHAQLLNTPAAPILPAEQAFQAEATLINPQTVQITLTIAPHTYLYQHKIQLDTTDATLAPPQWPPAERKQDAIFGETDIYRGAVTLDWPITELRQTPLRLQLTFQGCHDSGFCYPPQSKIFTVETPTAPTAGPPPWWTFFGMGLLLAITPCVLPMIPILSVLILGEQQRHHRLKAFSLALSYVLAMAFTYSGLGAVVSLLGNHLQAQLQTPWFLAASAGLLFLFAGTLVSVRLQAIVSRLSRPHPKWTKHLPQGQYLTAILMGVLATLIISPCITPPLVGALTLIAMHGQWVEGSLALFSLGLGMGLPLLGFTWIGTACLPRSGPWMQSVQILLSFTLSAVGIDLLGRFLAPSTTMGLYGIWALLLGYTLDSRFHLHWLPPIVAKALSRGILLVGILWIVGAALGNSDLLRPLHDLSAPATSHTATPQASTHGVTVYSVPELNAALEQAKQLQRPAVVDVYATWCTSCVAFQQRILPLDSVQAALATVQWITFDVTHYTPEIQQALSAWQLFGPPAFLFFDAQGNLLPERRHSGTLTETELLQALHALK